MTNGLQYDDDLFEDEEESELGISDIPAEAAPTPPARPQLHEVKRHHPEPNSPRRLRVRPMPKTMEDKYPDVVTCLLTQRDGRQVMLVRK